MTSVNQRDIDMYYIGNSSVSVESASDMECTSAMWAWRDFVLKLTGHDIAEETSLEQQRCNERADVASRQHIAE
jgi:hypothetical protein